MHKQGNQVEHTGQDQMWIGLDPRGGRNLILGTAKVLVQSARASAELGLSGRRRRSARALHVGAFSEALGVG